MQDGRSSRVPPARHFRETECVMRRNCAFGTYGMRSFGFDPVGDPKLEHRGSSQRCVSWGGRHAVKEVHDGPLRRRLFKTG